MRCKLEQDSVSNEASGNWPGVITLGILGAALCGVAAPLGAMMTGLKSGGWNWQFLPFIAGGFFGGIFIAIPASIGCGSLKPKYPWNLLIPLALPPISVFIFSALIFPSMKRDGQVRIERSREIFEQAQQSRQALLQQLKSDPEVALRERWFAGDDQHRYVMSASLRDGTVNYEFTLLKQIYEEDPSMSAIFAHPACKASFLAEHFKKAYEEYDAYFHGKVRYSPLRDIVSNPNTPRELVEKVATSQTLPVDVVYPARDNLERRKKQPIKPEHN